MKEMQAFMEGFKIQFDSYSPGFIEWTIFLALAGYILYRFWLFLNDPSHKKPHRAKILSHKSFNKKILKTVQWPEKEIPVMEEFLKMQEIESFQDLFNWTPWDQEGLPIQPRNTSNAYEDQQILDKLRAYVSQSKRHQREGLTKLKNSLEQNFATTDKFEFCPISKKVLLLGVPTSEAENIVNYLKHPDYSILNLFFYERTWKTYRGVYLQLTYRGTETLD